MVDNKTKSGTFWDGVKSFTSSLINSRTATEQNYVQADRLSDVSMRNIYRTGLGSKIVRIKAGDALKDTLQFESTDDETYYNARLASTVKRTARWCIAFGRGIIVLHHRGDDLSTPLGEVDKDRVMLSVFSGDMVTVNIAELDLQSPRYYKPNMYNVRGKPIHYSRVVDMTYIEPPELDKPYYRYGGISEFDLIYEQIIADGVVQRAVPRIIEKASALFYRVAGFKDAMIGGREKDMVAYFSRMEDLRGIMAAGIIDKDDELEVVTQNISNLGDADQITLRRLAMVTGISVTRLIGEAPRGMNSSGEKEAQMDQDMLETLQVDYFEPAINELMRKLGQGVVKFKDNQGETPTGRIDYEGKAIENALNLQLLGEDYSRYLEDKGVILPDDYDSMFNDET